jgi:hypothetical protein
LGILPVSLFPSAINKYELQYLVSKGKKLRQNTTRGKIYNYFAGIISIYEKRDCIYVISLSRGNSFSLSRGNSFTGGNLLLE